MKFAQISLLKMSITRNSRKFLELKLYGAKVVFAQNDSAKKKIRGNFLHGNYFAKNVALKFL